MKEHLKKYIDESITPEVRGLRILLEYFYATEIFEHILKNKTKIISVFGSARTRPESSEYKSACRLGELLYQQGFAVVTGASRGIMQAANQGVADAIARKMIRLKKADSLEEAQKIKTYKEELKDYSVGLSISLPKEAENNPYLGVNATFHYFMVRKFFFGTLSSGFIACEGGWGTRDELFEILTLVQTGKAPVMPIVYLSKDPRHLERDMQHAVRKKYIAPEDLHLIDLVKTPEQAARIIKQFYRRVESVRYEKDYSVRIFLKQGVSAPTRKKVENILSEHDKCFLKIFWNRNELVLRDYAPSSYGILKQAIHCLNQD